MKCVIAHDVGTSSVKSVLITVLGKVIECSVNEYPIYYSNHNWAEQDPLLYWDAIVKGTNKLIEKSKINKEEIVGIIHTTQSMGIIPVNKNGSVLRNNISWVDGRASEEATQIMKKVGGPRIFKRIVGTEIYGKDVIAKIIWIKKNEPEIYKNTYKFLDVNGFLRLKTTNKFTAERSGACSYGFSLKKNKWMVIFKVLGIDSNKLPNIVSSTDVVGTLTKNAANELNLKEGTPVFGGCDDTQSAAIGSGAVDTFGAHVYLGTSAWVGVTVKKDYGFKNGVATLASGDPNKNILVGITESAGANIEWVIKSFFPEENVDKDQDIFEVFEREMKCVPNGSDNLIMTPWFLGERAPVSSTSTRGTVFNVTHIHHRGHFARAACEGIAYNLRWIIENMKRDFNISIESLRVIGGGSDNDSWMQGLADVTKKKIVTTTNSKYAGAIGVAMCAFVGLGLYKDFNEIKKFVPENKTFIPNQSEFSNYDKSFRIYKKLYKSLHRTYKYMNRK